VNYFVLVGILIVVAGFALRLNPLLVVAVAAISTGLIAGKPLLAVVSAFGKAFNDNRFVTIIYILLPVIGLLERYGLQQRARTLIGGMRGATTARLLVAYLLFRQLFASLGLTSVAGHAQTVRPLVAPMAEAAAEKQDPGLDQSGRERVRAMAAATDNVGNFFGEDIFLAVGSILLMVGFLEQNGIRVEPLQMSVYAIPTAVLAFLIHGTRLLWMDKGLSSPRRRGGPANPLEGGHLSTAPEAAPLHQPGPGSSPRSGEEQG
jgi:uncharacterized membrane protein